MKYTCSKCGQEHEGRPSIAFSSPYQYEALSEKDKKSIASLSGDLCVIRHDEQTDRFIRAVFNQKVNDDCQTLDYGVRVSLSEKSFQYYVDNYNRDDSHEPHMPLPRMPSKTKAVVTAKCPPHRLK